MRDFRRFTLLEELLSDSDLSKEVRKDFMLAQKVFIDNVADWYWSHEQDNMDPARLPTNMPPFKSTWFEWSRPPKNRIWTGKGNAGMELFIPARTGCLLKRFEPQDDKIKVAYAIFFEPGYMKQFVVGSQVAPRGLLGTADLDLASGILAGEYRIIAPILLGPYAQFGPEEGRRLAEQHWSHLSSHSLNVVFTACAFMHCKNVLAPSEPLPETRARTKTFTPKYRGLQFAHLVIEPLRRQAATEARENDVSIVRALHICRGHFADYRDGNGLFGRLHGVYWIEAHVRGEQAVGEVRKTYEVKPSP